MNMTSDKKYEEDDVPSNFFMDVYQDGGKTKSRSSNSEPYLEKMVYNLEDGRTKLLLGSGVQEFTGKFLDNESGLIEQGVIIAGIEKEKCLIMAGLNDKTNLEGLECQHSKIKEYFDILSLEGDAYEDENVTNSHQGGVYFSRKNSEIKSAGMGKVGPIHSRKKNKLNGVSCRKHDTKHLTTNEEDFANDCGKSSSLSSVSSSDDNRSGIDAEDQNGEADMLFLKLKSIGKLSLPDKKDTVFDFPNDSSVSLTSSSPENLELKSKKEDACQKQYGGNSRSLPPTDNQPKNIRVPHLHFDEVADAESSIKATKQSENKMKENKTSRKNDEHIRLSIPKEIHKSEMGRMKMKKRMYGKTEGSASAHGAKIQVGKDKMMSKKEQSIQSDKSTWTKTQGHSGTQLKTNDTKILDKRSEILKRELRNFAEDVTPLPKSEKAEKGHSSCGVLVDIDACSDNSMASPSCPSFPSLSGKSSSAESSFMLTTNGSPAQSVNTFQEFERQNLAERKHRKKQFRLNIAEAKKKLIEARLLAQEETAAKRFNEALEKHTEIKLKRASMKDSMSKSATLTLGTSSSSSVVPVRKTFKDASLSVSSAGVSNIQEIRKAEADFDRAKVKQFQTKMKLQKKKILAKSSADHQGKKLKSIRKKDRERLERYDVEKMISELRSLNMIDNANKLSQAMERKEEYEAKLRHELNEERKHAAQLAKKQKLVELARIREEEKRKKTAQKERLEQERREREALQIAKRQAEAMKRREHNLKLQESLNYTLLATDTSRSFTYSYLPMLKTPVVQIEKDDRAEKPKKVKARYLEGV